MLVVLFSSNKRTTRNISIIFKCMGMSQLILHLLVNSNPKSVSNCSPHETRLNSHPKALPSLLFINLSSAIVESSIVPSFLGLVGAWFRNLNYSLDDILGIGKNPTVDPCKDAHEKPFEKTQSWMILRLNFFLQKLISSKLRGIGKNLSESSSIGSLKQPFDTICFDDLLHTISRGFILEFLVQLHPALYQFNWTHNDGVHQASKSSVLNTIPKTEFLLVSDLLKQLIRREDHCVDKGDSNEWIVDPIEQMQKPLVLNNTSEGTHHGQGMVHLHPDLESIEDIAGNTVCNS